MITGQQLRYINATVNVVAAVSGIAVNILLVFLLLSAKIPEFKNYNRLILQIAIIDIIESVIMVIIMPVVPIQFIYRYLLLCKNKTITNFVYASFFLVPFSISFGQIIIAHFTIYPNLNLPNHILQELMQYFKTTNPNEILIGTGGEHVS
uniref:G-protein coupled receptors family 1 profile domain-containing protein n=1 Tax=Panagrolaimus sp. ES5 TaxID=591445 RepID=A0AC34F8E8_9BILA